MKSAILLLLALPSAALQSQSAYDIIKRSEELVRGESSRGSFRMTVVTPEYSRTIVIDSWWKGTDKALIEIKAPAREAGNKTLKVGNELWMYLRNTETTIKIPPSMMMQSWNGSDFTNDDLVRESSLVDDYTMELAGADTVDGAACWIVDLRPKPTSPVVWGRTSVTDGSGYAAIVLSYSAGESVTLSAGGQAFHGDVFDEYWYYPSSLYLRAEYFFSSP